MGPKKPGSSGGGGSKGASMFLGTIESREDLKSAQQLNDYKENK
jgi:hypothetical protein